MSLQFRATLNIPLYSGWSEYTEFLCKKQRAYLMKWQKVFTFWEYC